MSPVDRSAIRQITEPARRIDVIHETDVLVVGCGPGGLGAALAAARAGADARLLERYGCFGGNITAVGVEAFAWYRHEQTRGLRRRRRPRSRRAPKAAGASTDESQSISQALDAERFKVVADALVEEAGIHPMLHRTFVAPDRRGRRRCAASSPRARPAARRSSPSASSTRPAMPTSPPGPGRRSRKTPREEMMSVSVMFSMTRRQQARVPRCGRRRLTQLPRLGRQRRVGHRRPTARRTRCSRPSCASRSRRPSRRG